MRELWPHQQRAVALARESFRTGHKRPLIVIPTGGGKTITATYIAQQIVAKGGSVLWTAHREELVAQAFDSLTSAGLECGAIMSKPTRAVNPHRKTQVASVQTLLARENYPDVSFIVQDECVTGDTVIGGRRAQDIQVGDMVEAWTGDTCVKRKVSHVFVNRASALLAIQVGDQHLTCTHSHPIWVHGKGFIYASEVRIGDLCRMWSADGTRCEGQAAEDMQRRVSPCIADSGAGGDSSQEAPAAADVHAMREAHGLAALWGLEQNLLESLHEQIALDHNGRNQSSPRVTEDDRSQSDEERSHARGSERYASTHRAQAVCARGQWSGAHTSASYVARCPRRALGCRTGNKSRGPTENGAAPLCKDRFGQPGINVSDRSGRGVSRRTESAGGRCQEDCVSHFARVDSIEVLEPGSDGSFGGRAPCGIVYNFEVEGEHNFFANGILTHNCHHLVAESWKKLDDHYRAKGVLGLGLTATPVRADGRALGDVFDDILVPVTMMELVTAGVLVPCRIVGPDRPLRSNEIAARPVDAYKAHAEGRKTILFAGNIKAANSFAGEFAEAGYKVGVVTGAMDPGERRTTLGAFKAGKINILCNVGIATEGFDDTPTSCVILARSLGSLGLYLQIVGRALRSAPHVGKTDALLIDLHGSSRAFGPPDEDREYSLDGDGITRKNAEKMPNAFCAGCGVTVAPGSTVCGKCSVEKPELNVPNVVKAKLIRYENKMRESPEKRRAYFEKLKKTAAEKGYSKWWPVTKYKVLYGERPPPGW